MAQDPYLALGVARGATDEEIRKSFRRLAKAHHPDVNPGDKSAEEKFKRASAAFDILGDVQQRKRYDAGEIDADGREIQRGFSGGPFGGAAGAEFENVDLSEILGQMFGEGQRAGRRGRRGRFASRGQDLRARLELDLEEAIAGGKKRVVFADGRALDVAIPAGVAEGRVLRLKGQGEAGPAGPGDVLVEIALRPHPVFRRESDALVMDLALSVPDAVLGGKIDAPTPDGPVSLRIPRGSNSGSTLRLKGRGLVAADGRRGDLLARLIVVLPELEDHELERYCETWRRDRPYLAGPFRTAGT